MTPRDEGGWAKGQFEHKCLSIMQSCWTEFGEFIIYFNEPVSRTMHHSPFICCATRPVSFLEQLKLVQARHGCLNPRWL